MISLVVAVVLTGSEPSAALLAPHFVQALTQDPAGPMSEQPPPPPPVPAAEPTPGAAAAQPAPDPGNDPYAGRSRRSLMTEVWSLEDSRPNLTPLWLVTIAGGALTFVDVIALVTRPQFNSLPIEFLGVIAAGAGAAFVIGGVLLFLAIRRSAAIDADLAAVRSAVDRAPEDAPRYYPPPEDQPQPQQPDYPPAMPPQVSLPPPMIAFTVATF